MTPSDLKYEVEKAGNSPYFFSRKTMKFFGDTLANYGCRTAFIKREKSENMVECWELWRKRPVKHRLRSSAYFRKDNFKRVFIAIL